MSSETTNDFLANNKPHVLMITNHGFHDWQIRSGLKDTGGQNHYVNALSDTLVDLGYKVTIMNRGGFADPVTAKIREGIHAKSKDARIFYLCGGADQFIAKENLTLEILDEEASFACRQLAKEQSQVNLIISHYWDGAVVAGLIKKKLALQTKHIWVPHSLGALKKENFKSKSAEIIQAMHFEERINFEKNVLKTVDMVGSTSGDITRVLKQEYQYTPQIFLPPCIDTNKVYPTTLREDSPLFSFLRQQDPIADPLAPGKRCLLEISRTDVTKRKDVVIMAFAEIIKKHPETWLLLTLSPDNNTLFDELDQLINRLGIRQRVVYLGMIPRQLIPELYALCTVYCSPSEMEGFGMSVQEACACQRPVVTSQLVPFVTEFLMKNSHKEVIQTAQGACSVTWGEGGAVVLAGEIGGFAHAIDRLLTDPNLYHDMADKAYAVTIPYFTWPQITKIMLSQIGLAIPNE